MILLKSVFLIAIIAFVMIGMMVPSAFAYTITDDATGGDCSTIGTWDSASKTCTLTTDVLGNIVINSDDIILDGDGHTLDIVMNSPNSNGEYPQGGIFSIDHSNITIKNFNIESTAELGSTYGIVLKGSVDNFLNKNNVIESNTILGFELTRGIFVSLEYRDTYLAYPSTNLIVKNNVIETYETGIWIHSHGGDEVFENTITGNKQNSVGIVWFQGLSDQSSTSLIYDNILSNLETAFTLCRGVEVYQNEVTNFDSITRNNGSSCNLYDVYHNNFWDYDLTYGFMTVGGSSNFSGNYWEHYDSPTDTHSNIGQGCNDANYDNICDDPYGIATSDDDSPWNIPNGWQTTITSNESITDQEATSSSGTSVSFSSITAQKNGNSVPVTCSPASDSIFSLGTTQVICQTDEGRTTSFDITVSDTISPTIIIPVDISEITSVPQGLSVDFDVSATDAVGLENPVSCSASSGELFPIGDTTVTCTATDTSGNESSESFTVTVASDTPPPTINVPSNVAVVAETSSGINADYPQVTATDPLGVSSGPTCDYVSGSFFNVGTTTITCTATNTPGFSSTATFTITVNPPPSITSDVLPTRQQIGYDWQYPTNRQVYNELDKSRGYQPTDFPGFVEYTWRGHMKGGYDPNYLDLYIYRFNSEINSESFYLDHLNYWENRGGYSQWSPNISGLSADECYGRITSGMWNDKISLYCFKDNIVTFSTATGYEWEMKDELTDIANAVFDNYSNDYPNADAAAQQAAADAAAQQAAQQAAADAAAQQAAAPLIEESGIIFDGNNEISLEITQTQYDVGDTVRIYAIFPFESGSVGQYLITDAEENRIISKSFVQRSDSIYFEQEIDSSWKSGLYVFEIYWELMNKSISFYVENNVIPEISMSSIPSEPSIVTSNIASFVDQTKDPQHYIDRYTNEPAYKEWFDENYSQYSSIYQAVGLTEPVSEQKINCGPGTEEVNGTCQVIQNTEYTPEPVSEQKINCGPGTEEVNGICQVIQTNTSNSQLTAEQERQNLIAEAEQFANQLEQEQREAVERGGGCLIATATYGSEMSQQVQQLRELRDNQLLNTESGTAFMGTFNDIYYSFSPIIADYERENPYFKETVKIAITPMISTLSLMENANSESEVLGLGLSVIMLNLGMYLGIPAIVVIGIRKKF